MGMNETTPALRGQARATIDDWNHYGVFIVCQGDYLR